jgi:predicted phage terminase large subunit-like protein
MEDKKFESPELFAVQYMGDVSGGESQIIKQLATYDEVPNKELIEEKDLLVAVGVDPAYKDKEKNDFSVCYVGGLDAHGRIWILDRRKGRFSTPELMDELYDIQEEWEPFTQWVEDSAAGTPAVQTIQAESPDVPLETVPPSQGGKRSRVHALSPYIHRGQIIFPKMAAWFEDAKYQLTHYGFTGFDDDPDALWTLVSQLLDVPHPSAYDRRRDARGIKMR